MLGGVSKGYFLLLVLLLIFLYSIVHTSVYAASNLEADTGNKNSHQQQISLSEEMNNTDGINSLKSNHTSLSNDLRSPLAGTLQIPYTGLVTRSLSPSLAERLGLDATTRGDVIVDIIPGSPAERLGMRALNMSRTGSIEEIMASRGDIISAVDGSTAFTTNYRNIEQYVIENKKVGENITLSLLRDGQSKDIEMTLASMPRFLWYENRNEGIKMKYPSGSNDTSMTQGSSIRPDIKIFRILDINKTTLDKLSGYSTVFYDYSLTEHTRKILTVFVERDSQIYSINFSADPTRYDDYLPLAREMIESVQFIDNT